MLKVAVVEVGFGDGAFKVAPAGSPVTLSVTAFEKPLMGFTVTV